MTTTKIFTCKHGNPATKPCAECAREVRDIKATSARKTRDLCQICWQDANPTEYFPVSIRTGECAECGNWAMVVRSTIRFEAT